MASYDALQEADGKTLLECRDMCNRGLNADSTAYHDRHGYWSRVQPAYAECYGFHWDEGASVTGPNSNGCDNGPSFSAWFSAFPWTITFNFGDNKELLGTSLLIID